MTTIILTGATLSDLATGTALFAASNDHSVMDCVELSLDAYGLTARASDRYRAIVGHVAAKGHSDVTGDAITVLIDAKWLLATAKANKSALAVTLELTERLVSVSTPTGGQSRETMEGYFPGIEKLFTQYREAAATEYVAFNPSFLADIAKIPAKLSQRKSSGAAPIRLELRGTNKPAFFTIEHATVSWKGLLMPVRMD